MSFNINSDKERIRGSKPQIIGDNEVTIRSGVDASEREILRAQLDSETSLPRVGINRTGQRVNNIDIVSGGSGYTVVPTVTIDPPTTAGGVQALASAFIFNGRVVNVAINNPGSGYTQTPNVVITGGNGAGCIVQAFLDTVDFELDINGAIRTSTSIISDTARILNLDIDNFVTPDAAFRGPNLKTFVNNTGIPWADNVIIQKDSYRYFGSNVYQALNSGQTGDLAPEHLDGIVLNGEVQFKHIGFRVVDANAFGYNETGDAGVFPRSITPLLGDRSDKIATTEYVLNLATNDVGGRIYVSQQIGSNLNDGRSAVNPVRTIKKACQLAWQTPGVKETIIVSGGDYVEDNPISIPPDASIVGDNLRLVIIRPANPGKHIMKFGDKNYVIGVTYRDFIDSNDDPVHTWDFAMVFDDKQRIIIDNEVNGDFGVDFPVGHQIFGPQQYRIGFQNNTGLSALQTGLEIVGQNQGGRANIIGVDFASTTGANAYVSGSIDVRLTSGTVIEGEVFDYITSGSQGLAITPNADSILPNNFLRFSQDPTTEYTDGRYVYLSIVPATGSPFAGYYQVVDTDDTVPGQWDVQFVPVLGSPSWNRSDSAGVIANAATVNVESFDSITLESIRAEGEIVSVDDDVTSTYPIVRLDFSLQGDPSIATGGFQYEQFGDAEDLGGIVFYTSELVGRTNTHELKEGQEITITGLPTANPDLSFLNGKQRIYKVLDDADGRARRFVIPKKVPTITDANFDPGQFAEVKSYSKVLTLSLLNSPNTFPLSTPVERRYQDACVYIRNNRDFIADEVVGRINDEFKKEYFAVYNVSGSSFDIYLGPSRFEHIYDAANPTGIVTFGGSDYNITNFLYDTAVTGVATITTASPVAGLAEDSTVKLAGLEVNCDNGTKVYPSFNIPVSDEQCKQDIVHFLNALVRDLEFGSNHNIIEAAEKYIVGAKIDYVENEIIQTVRAIEYARELAIYAMCNWRTGDRRPGDPVYTPRYSSLTRYFDGSVITATAGTPACDDVRSAIDTLSYLWVDVIANNTSGTFLDGAYLITRNRDLIADQALLDTELTYPSLGLSDLNQRKCRRDINYVLSGLIRDLALGGNSGIVTAAEAYFTGSALTGIPEAQRDETIYAFQQAFGYAQNAIQNWVAPTNIEEVTPTNATYNSTTGIVEITIPTPNTIPQGLSLGQTDRIAFKEGALTFNCTSNGGGDLASPTPTDRNYGKSLPIIDVVNLGGTVRISCDVGDAGSATGVAHTFVSALASGTVLIFNPIQTTSPIPKFEDWNILIDSNPNRCAQVDSAISTSLGTLVDILDGSVLPGETAVNTGTLYDTSLLITYPDSYVYDLGNQRMSIRGYYDDYPIIEASPYTQNASVISFLGGGGALVDGSKVKQPNCPFPGLELDGTASYPNQGKSMVASAFTIVSFGGTGYKVIEDGYTQLVSVFVIFCADGVLAESGGYCSITNSATNFGQFALRGIGYRKDPYDFDIATITNVSATPTGRTILTVNGLGREPLEHYVVKIDGYENTGKDDGVEYFVDVVGAVTVGPPFSAQLTIDDGTGGAMDLTDISTGNPVSTGVLVGTTINLHRPSIVNSSSHTWEFAGSGTNYLALPENGGTKIEANEQVSENYGRVYVSGTDELGDFKVGTFARIENRTGNITFTGTVTISEVEFLKLKGGDVVVTGFDASNTLGGANSTDSKLPTQKAVKDYITNNLGPYINKPYSTNAVPRALVELTDSGKISIDQIPALRPFSVFTVANQTERLAIEGALAGDIAIQQDTTTSYILNNDLDSLFLGFAVDPTLQFTIGDIFTGSVSNGRIQAIEYREGVLYRINITNGGSGYTSPPTITISGGNPGLGAVQAAATCTIANGEVVTVDIINFNGYKGGKGYTTVPTVTFAAPAGGGTQATGTALLESRLYGDIVNRISIEDTDNIDSSDIPAVTVNINRVQNTSASDSNNWVSLSSNQIAASDIVSGVIETDRLATGGAANSFTFLRGDQNFALAVQSIKGSEKRYFDKLYSQANSGTSQLIFTTNADVLIGHEVVANVAGVQANTNITGVLTTGGLTTISLNNPITQTIPINTIIEFERGDSPMVFESSYTQGGFVDDIVISNGGVGFTNGQYFDIELTGGTGTGLRANIIVSNNTISSITVTDGGSGYNSDFSITVEPLELGTGSGMVLESKISTVNRQYANVSIDVARVTDLTISSDLYGTIGVSRFKKAQFNLGQAGNGSVELKTGPDSGLDADLLDGAQGSFYLNSSNQNSGTLPTDRLAGTYNIAISGQSANTIRLLTGQNNPTSNPSPNSFQAGIVSNTVNNSSNGLETAFPSVTAGQGSTKHLVLTLRNGASGLDASSGGVRQLAFADDDSMYLRGSGSSVTTFGSWAKVWHSLNDGVGSGLDSDRLDNKQGTWYQNALNINYGTLSDNRLPRFISAHAVRDSLQIKSYNGDPKYRIYISGRILTTSPFVPGQSVNLYNANAQGTGTIEIDNIVTNNDTVDNFNDYTIIEGRLSTGNFVGALTIGTATQREEFQDFTIMDSNTIQVAELESDSGTANLRLGRKDGIQSSPGVYFNSSQLAANYNAAIIASGGNATDGSGTLNAQVANANGLSVNGNIVWNAGNITFQSSNVANTAVKRDANGNFSAGTITASITGAASLNVLKAGDTMTGSLTLTGTGSNLSVQGTSTLTGNVTMTNDLNVDANTLYVDSADNRVAVGNNNPQKKVDIQAGDNDALIISNAVGSNNNGIGLSLGSSAPWIDFKGGRLDFKLNSTLGTWNSGNYRVMTLLQDGTSNTSGKVGINTTSPSANFHVTGNSILATATSYDMDSVGNSVFAGSINVSGWGITAGIGGKAGTGDVFGLGTNGSNFYMGYGDGASNDSVRTFLRVDNSRNVYLAESQGGVAISTNVLSGTDPETSQNRTYVLNVGGDMNINGQLFQNNAEFVTSRWTEATNNTDIYRLSRVGINKIDPTFTLHIDGSVNIEGSTDAGNRVLYANGEKQWLDKWGVFKANRNFVQENVTIPANTNCVTAGPITINNGVTVTINSGGNWAIV